MALKRPAPRSGRWLEVARASARPPGRRSPGRLPGRTAEVVLVAAHHDTAPDAPGAYDDGGGVGVLIETARLLARAGPGARTVEFVSFDGEEAWSTGRTLVAGSREYVRALGPRARDIAGALVVEMCGWKGGTPVLHPIPYADPLRPGRYVASPAWLVGAAQRGARKAGTPLAVGDPLIPWLYQPAVRTLRVRLYGDDLALLQAGVPAVFASDSSFTAFYPWYHQASDTADKLDAASLARMGRAVVGAVEALSTAERAPAGQPQSFAAFGGVATAPWLYAAGAASLVPRLFRAAAARGIPAGLVLQAGLFALLMWRHPVPALWVFVLPNLLAGRGRFWSALAVLPLAALSALGILAAARGFAGGLWIAPWELAVAAAALGLAWVTAQDRRARTA